MIDQHLIVKNTLNRIDHLTNASSGAASLFKQLYSVGDVIIVGGAIRDFAFNKKFRDIDIIVENSNDTNLDDILEAFDYRKNRFGGYKISIDNLEFDIWSMSENWAFKNEILPSSFSNISKGSFYNFDAIAFNATTKKLDAEVFMETLHHKILDITLEDKFIDFNPTPEVNIVRAFHIHDKWELDFSEKLKYYIETWFSKKGNSFEILKKAEQKHYGYVDEAKKYEIFW